MFFSFYSCDVTFFLHSPCILLCFSTSYSSFLFVHLFLTILLGLSLSPICPLWVPHLSLICPPDLSCPQLSLLPALHFSYTLTTLTNLAPLAIKLHLAYTCNQYFPVLPGCVSLPNPTLLTVFPFHSFLPLLQLLIFIFFLITSHVTSMPIFPALPFSSILPPLNFQAHCYPHFAQLPQTFLSCSPSTYLLQASSSISQPIVTLRVTRMLLSMAPSTSFFFSLFLYNH